MKVAFITLGCKVNQYETQAMESLLGESGHTVSELGEADIIVVNTCAVTAESARKSRQAARRAHRLNPSARLVVCGCYAESDPDGASADGVDFIGGVKSRRDVVAYIDSLADNLTEYAPVESNGAYEELPSGSFDGHARAYLKIQDGCDNFCAYCIIPHLRGRARSLAPQRAVEEAVRLAESYKEIVLTGIEITAYGRDIGTDLITLVERIADAVKGRARLRLGSLEPSYITDDVAARLARLGGGVCPHFHLSLQSGTTATLRRMRRKYTAAQYADTVGRLRAVFADPAITTDLIVGFPGETDDDFEETLRFISRVGFAAVHVFPYSLRPGTDAAAFGGQLPADVKRERAKRAAAAASETRAAYLAAQVGRVLEVLMEDKHSGHSENYLEVNIAVGNDVNIEPRDDESDVCQVAGDIAHLTDAPQCGESSGTRGRGAIVRTRIVGVRSDGRLEGTTCP